jgi:hypothetical protein
MFLSKRNHVLVLFFYIAQDFNFAKFRKDLLARPPNLYISVFLVLFGCVTWPFMKALNSFRPAKGTIWPVQIRCDVSGGASVRT